MHIVSQFTTESHEEVWVISLLETDESVEPRLFGKNALTHVNIFFDDLTHYLTCQAKLLLWKCEL